MNSDDLGGAPVRLMTVFRNSTLPHIMLEIPLEISLKDFKARLKEHGARPCFRGEEMQQLIEGVLYENRTLHAEPRPGGWKVFREAERRDAIAEDELYKILIRASRVIRPKRPAIQPAHANALPA